MIFFENRNYESLRNITKFVIRVLQSNSNDEKFWSKILETSQFRII